MACVKNFKSYNIEDRLTLLDSILDIIDGYEEELNISDLIQKIYDTTIYPIIFDGEKYDTQSILELHDYIKSEVKNNDSYRNQLNLLIAKLEDIQQDSNETQVDFRSQPEVHAIDEGIYPTVQPLWDRMDVLFEDYPELKSQFIYDFQTSIIDKILVDFNKQIIIFDNPKLLDKNLFNYKTQLLENLSQYLIDRGISLQVPKDYIKNNKLTEEGIDFYYEVLKQANAVFNPNNIKSIYYASLSKDVTSLKTMNAFKAFLLLSTDGKVMGIDTLLEYSFPKLISIKKSSLFNNNYVLKLERTVQSPFGNDRMTDGEKTMGAVAKLLLTSVPAIMSDGTVNGVLDYTQILQTIRKFSNNETRRKASVYSELQKPLNNLYNNPIDSLITLFNIILNRKIQSYNSVFNFSEADRTVLRSLYDRFFNVNKNSSLISLELSKIRTSSAVTSFSLLSTVIGGLIRQETCDFLQNKNREGTIVIEDINQNRVNNTIKSISSRISQEIKGSKELLEYRIKSLNLRFNTLPENSNTFKGMLNDSIAFDIQLSSGKILKVVINSKDDEVKANYIQLYDGDTLIKFERSSKKDSKSPIVFPTSTQIVSYFNKNLNSEILENPGLEIPLLLLSVINKLAPRLKLTSENINVLLQWLNNAEYDTNPENRETFFLNQVSEVIHALARNSLLQYQINKNPEMDVKKLMEGYPDINSIKVFNWFDTGTNTLNLLWDKPKMGFRQLATAYDQVLSRIQKMVSDAEGNKLPKSRNFTIINHVEHCMQTMLDDDNAKEIYGVGKKYIGALKSNLLAKPENLLSLGKSYVYLDVTNQQGESKKVSTLSSEEQTYNNFINLYLNCLINSDSPNFYIQPTTFSDKSTICVIGIPKSEFVGSTGKILDFSSITVSQLKSEINYSIGGYYKQVLDNVLKDYRKIFANLDSVYLQSLIDKVVQYEIPKNLHPTVRAQLNQFKQAVINKPDNIDMWGIDIFAGLFTAIEDIQPLKDIATRLGIELVNDVHFSNNHMKEIGLGDYSINYQLYYYSQKLFGNENLIEDYYKENLNKFIDYLSDLTLSTDDPVIDIAVQKYNLENWVNDDGNLILKRNGKINPLIEKYFYTQYLVKQNLKQVLAGGEIGHPHKLKLKLGSSEFNENTTFQDIMIREESGRMTSSFKRTVDLGVPGIMAIQKDILTVPPKVRSAIISDMKAPNYNIYGQTEDTDAHDGESFTHPLYNILMRLGQQDCAGGEILKMILRDQHSKYGVNILYKYASDAMMNYDMRASLGFNDIEDELGDGKFQSINMRKMFKKLSSIPFDRETDELDKIPEAAKIIRIKHKPKEDGSTEPDTLIPYEIDLTRNLYDQPIKPTDMSAGNPIYYREGNRYYRLDNLERTKDKIPGFIDNTKYEITLQEVVIEDGRILTVGDPIIKSQQTINTIDQLFNVLGGVYSVDFKDGRFVYGNNSLYTLANYVNNIGRTYNSDKKNFGTRAYTYPTQDNTWQPLKTKFIASLTNQSAIKNGAANVNPSSRFYDEEPFATQIIRTNQHLLVQDYDHIVTDGETTLSEFTQVITATIQLGNSFKTVDRLFQALTNVSAANMLQITNGVNSVLKNASNKKQLYYIIGRLLIEDAKRKNQQSNLYEQLIINLAKEYKEAVQNNDSFKFPFSDPQAFTTSVTSIISTINKLSIKRKFPGSGLIMAGGYGIAKTFNFPGQSTKSFEDVLNWIYKVQQTGLNWSSEWKNNKLNVNFDETTKQIRDITLNGESILNSNELQYIDVETGTQLYKIIFNLQNTYGQLDLNNLSSNLEANLKLILRHINNFTFSDESFLEDVNQQIVKNFRNYIKELQLDLFQNKQEPLKPVTEIRLGQCITLVSKAGTFERVNIDSLSKLRQYQDSVEYDGFFVDYSQSRNLLPTSIKFKDKLSGKTIDLYNLPVIQQCITQLQQKGLDKTQQKELQLIIDDELHRIHSGQYTSNAILTFEYGVYQLKDQKISDILEDSLQVSDYEAKIPMIFKSEYGLKEGDSLSDILEQGYKFFQNRYAEKYTPKLITGYDVCFTKNSGKHDYITFNRPKRQQEVYIDPFHLEEDGDYKYVVDADGNRLYARYKKRVNENGEAIKQQTTDENGNVIESEIWDDYIIQLIPSNGATENLFYIAYGETEVDKAKVAASMYSKQNNETIFINQNLYKNRIPYIIELFKQLSEKNIYIPRDHQILLEQLTSDNWQETIQNINSSFMYSDSKAKSIFNSFKKSLELIVARIPAQSMQSFMKMKIVGFLETDKNYIQVSHFQTWIQGSDYDIDKAYTMALSIKENGELWMWSPWANLASEQAFKWSLELPIPSGNEVFISDNEQSVNISNLVDIIMSNWDRNQNGTYKQNSENMFSTLQNDEYKGLYPYIVQLLQEVGDHKSVYISKEIIDKYGKSNIGYIIFDRIINTHTKYFSNLDQGSSYDKNKPSRKDIANIFKNITTLSLMDVITDIRNLSAAMSPVSMGEAGEAADMSTLGKNSKTRIDMAPTTVAETTEEFLVGKSGIGIAANGVKVNFSLLYHTLKNIKSGNKDQLATLPFYVHLIVNGLEKEYAVFSGINKNTISEDEYKRLKNITKDYLIRLGRTEEQANQILEPLKYSGKDQSQALSALLSAATDNAKELILKKINADDRYMKCYIFGMVLGMTIPEISQIMTSKEISYIIKKTKDNIFTGYGLNEKDIISQLLSGESLILDQKSLNILLKEMNLENETELNVLISESFQEGKVPFDNKLIKKLEQNPDFDINLLKTFIREQESLLKHKSTDSENIIEAFRILKQGGDELTKLAQLLSINQGISPNPHDLIEFIIKLENIFNSRIRNKSLPQIRKNLEILYQIQGYSDYKIKADKVIDYIENEQLKTKETFNLIKFLNPNEKVYRQMILDISEACKIMINPFSVILNIPYINEAFNSLFKGVTSINKLTPRYQLLYDIRKNLSIRKLSNKQKSAINDIINSQIIFNWVSQQNIEIPLIQGNIIYQDFKPDTYISGIKDLSTLDNIATFQYWMETTFLNVIQHPELYSDIDSKTAKILRNNALIQDLEINTYYDTYSGVNVQAILLPDVNLMNIDEPGIDQDKYYQYLNAVRQLKDVKIFGRPIIDWLFLYNLVVFKNMPRINNFNVLFKPYVTDRTTLVGKYNYDQGNNDWNNINIFDIVGFDDFEKAIAPIATKSSLRTKAIKDYKYIRIFDPTVGGYALYLNIGQPSEEERQIVGEEEFHSYLSGYSKVLSLNNSIIANYYRLRLLSYQQNRSSYLIEENTPINEVYLKFINNMNRGIITIKTEC